MSVEPSEEAIENFILFTSSSRKEAIDFLKKSNLDTQRAINAYYENPPTPFIESIAGQESSAYSSYQNQDVPAFNIDNTDTQQRNNDYKAPPSRPPSRMNNRNVTSFTLPGETNEGSAGNNTSANTGQGLSLAEREDEEMRQALAMSLNQELPGQETGVTQAANTQLSRANKDFYDENEWGMTLFNETPEEAIISPDPEDRKRVNDEPAFIRPSERYQQLGSLITILHAVPIAREALLLRDGVRAGYGYDKQWWNGQPITIPETGQDDSNYGGNSNQDDLLCEAQRLMAFLNSSERAFGSADSLSSITWNRASTTNLERGPSEFLENWHLAALEATPNNQLATIFSSLAYKKSSEEADEPIEKLFVVFDADVLEGGLSLYEALDATLWPDVDGEFDDVWLDRVGEVFTMKLTRSYSQNPVDVKIPAVWYPDRYLDSCKETALEFRKRKLETLKEISRLDSLRNRFTSSWAGLNTQVNQVNNLETLELAADCAEIAQKGNSASSITEGDNTSTVREDVVDNGNSIAAALKKISKRIEAKLEELERRKQEAQETFRKHSKVLTEQTSSTDPPYNKYTLRGVSTLPHVTYVLKRRVPEEGTQDAHEANRPDEWQWWRISFSTDDAKARLAEETQTAAVASSQGGPTPDQQETKKKREIPRNADVVGYTARKVREIEVLKAAREESSTVILVYANEHAVNFKESGLPLELQNFVNTDNTSFNDELEGIDDASNDEVRQEDSWPTWDGPSDDPSPNDNNPEPNPAANVNVHDYEVSSFTEREGQETASAGQEMQERRGSAFLGQASRSGLIPHHSMDQILEEADEDGKGLNHIEHVN